MKKYESWTEYIEENGLDPVSAHRYFANATKDINKGYAGLHVYGSTAIGMFELSVRGEVVALITDASEADVRADIRETAYEDMPCYYWLETGRVVGCDPDGFAMWRGERDLFGEKDRETEEILFTACFDEAGFTEEDDEDPCEFNWEKLDAFIESKIGFVPDYEIN